MNVALFGRKVNKQNLVYFEELIQILLSFGWTPILEKSLKENLAEKNPQMAKFGVFESHSDFKSGIDLTISMGGDGTFIETVGYIRDSQVPIIGINTGRLGFLANISRDQIESSLDMIRNKKYEYQLRSLLRIKTEENLFGDDNFALNEVTFHKKDTSSMINVHASLDNKYLNSYWADGLIVSTPTGSTAYSLSCGGPIVTPGCKVHILTPIAPHNLNVRPMVVPDHLPIKLSLDGRERKYLISLDGKSMNIRRGEEVLIEKAEFMINVIKFEENNFLDTIRNKMLWGKDKRN
ncbi:MAG: NAD kinase [Crocinitomicaceae bacterium]|jgi:NAD+ kinase|nr:NAD kinase [Crocinitomicaceae bacterium]MDP4867106.1 NAD kinase [Crocinitomicaceae bacterium]MDP5010553.1 NAD kinase [Crocinitomicaceae bacterium]